MANPGEITVAAFFKPPVAGEVKTRLAPRIGSRAAARLAGAFMIDTLELLRSLAGVRIVVATTGELDPTWRDHLAGVPVWTQGQGDLGDRLERILSRALAEGAPAAAAVGADSPGLPRAHLEAALDALASHDAVLGPADDGLLPDRPAPLSRRSARRDHLEQRANPV